LTWIRILGKQDLAAATVCRCRYLWLCKLIRWSTSLWSWRWFLCIDVARHIQCNCWSHSINVH